mmetsp:Transcript_24258/g.45164  ORF Transcript_24258/g.45164 Transcript_24258/m.45164 type:complete len:208 (+) Transcript_24258:919-1542(+)
MINKSLQKMEADLLLLLETVVDNAVVARKRKGEGVEVAREAEIILVIVTTALLQEETETTRGGSSLGGGVMVVDQVVSLCTEEDLTDRQEEDDMTMITAVMADIKQGLEENVLAAVTGVLGEEAEEDKIETAVLLRMITVVPEEAGTSIVEAVIEGGTVGEAMMADLFVVEVAGGNGDDDTHLACPKSFLHRLSFEHMVFKKEGIFE